MFESLIAEDNRNTEDGDTKQAEAGLNQAEVDMRLNLDEDWRKKRKRRKLPMLSSFLQKSSHLI